MYDNALMFSDMTYFEAACENTMKNKSSQMRQYADMWYKRSTQSKNISLGMICAYVEKRLRQPA